MVTVINYAVKQNGEGEEFLVLVLQGDVDIVQSESTGNFYATAYKTTISTTLDEILAAKMVGKELPGKIIKEDCEPYEYVIPETGEAITLSHTYKYLSEEPSKVSVETLQTFSQNGHMAMA